MRTVIDRMTLRRAWASGLLVCTACATRGPGPVSPAEIPMLQQQVKRNPTDGGGLLRLAAALFADDRCDEALPIAERGRFLRTRDPLGVLVVGQCLEREGRYADAVEAYESFLVSWPDAPGAAAVRGRQYTARRALVRERAQKALAGEAQLSSSAPDPMTVAVLPLLVTGDSSYAPLSIGLAALISSDLDLLDRFQLVERIQLDALLQELELGASQLVDPSTRARLGNLMRAGRMVQGLAEFEGSSTARLEATVVAEGNDIAVTGAESGRLNDLLRLEKALVIGVAERLGPPLTLAERTRILDNGTQNLMAFLAYSRGIDAELRGEYGAAVEHFSAAVRADPRFTQARERLTIAAAAEVVADATPEEVTTLAAEADAAVADAQTDFSSPLGGVLSNSLFDVASTQGERATGTGGDPNGRELIRLTGTPANGATSGIERLSIPVLVRILIPVPR
jgi:tetratricopeptide (TPR) repeat protein